MIKQWRGKEALQSVKKEVHRRLTAVGEFGEKTAKLLAPVRTGRLRDSITYRVSDDTVEIGTSVEYAPFIEFGTGEFAEGGDGRKGGWVFTTPEGQTFFTYGNKPQPFLRPLITTHKKQIKQIMQS